MWIRITVTDPPHTATGYNHTSSFSQCPVLPYHKLSVGCMPEPFVAFTKSNNISLRPYLCPNPSCKVKDPLHQYKLVHVLHHGHAGVSRFSTALVLNVGGHLPAVGANAPGRLGCRRLWLRSLRSKCLVCQVKHHAGVLGQVAPQESLALLQIQLSNSGL